MTSVTTTPHDLAPIVLFVHDRVLHTKQTLRALKENDLAQQSTLYVYSDGPKHMAPKESCERIEAVRRLVRSERWCGEVTVVEAPRNLGLVNAIIRGVTEVVNRHGRVIVLEDDQITSRGFLRYMNEALELYRDDEKVMHVSAYMYPSQFESKETTFFLNILSCWGWGTWKRAWAHYSHDAKEHFSFFNETRERRRKFDIEGNAYYFAQLKANAENPSFSWAVRWYASCARAGGLALFPARSLVRNIGLDGTGVHCAPTTMYDVEPVDYLEIRRVPIVEDLAIRKSVDEFYRKGLKRRRPSVLKTLPRGVARLLGAGRIRKLLRRGLVRVLPELSVLDAEAGGAGAIGSTHRDSEVSEKAKVYSPYHTYESRIGDYTYVAKGAWISSTTIGKFCSIGPNFSSGWGIHPVDCLSTSPMFYSIGMQNGITLCDHNKVQERKPIRIGNDVFIGMNVTVLDGVTVGDGAVIGAGTVVSKDVPPYAIVVGNPMRILRSRFPEDMVARLLETAWWDWPLEELQKVEEHFFDVEGFLARYGRSPGGTETSNV